MKTIKVILTDDHKIIRDGIKSMLMDDPYIEIVAEAGTGVELIERISAVSADVVLMDINMPEMDGLEATKYIHENFISTRILVLSMLDQEHQIKLMLEAGASGYILKKSGQEELINAIKVVASGQNYLSTDIAMNLLKKIDASGASPADSNAKVTSEISKREMEVLKLISEGYTNAQIADKLFTSKRTIESHRRNLIEKTKTKNTAELVKYALSKGFIY